ncbi:MAG: hypothetical protein UU82_C0024G0002 [Candidatus Nomurabacteria bacterium GW2011_GWC2_41_8]|uniref:EamA domain-containing protein n=3 Tax=Candidatus Nomuraibacteriota TaxID=1752729 RepID=A0A1F6YD75_9BACT|nr:MAG: hypothetical protein UU58_C0007G0031 [Candidatus Nomurabacteria bacterium GW2011_GWA2_41_25]KKS23632.1 MAG: hypothetical protein UU82_C0024G0002 [Candidatus Nomurabacteria bacterium GW2011_GWC2_41_8]OGI66902.1 MAG: hypothetical protein A2823_01360 [Candidatus Nomurabacteria bacterium RIFCSPHIGHO2_01_FULL_41_91]OGI80613.1 MAG: hypothetical protein A3D43_02695 [Candidatus Nomurabacteria bacterium RIFCSPHIGHO2_02_FULL_41_52]OGI85222.1 MAG: hypothetical protein A3F49_00855 [Candidatus Nomur
MFWVIPLIFLILFEIVADIFAKEYSLRDNWYFWGGALLAYVLANMFWLWAIKSGSGLARGAIIFSVSSAVLAIIIGLYFYGEQTNKFQFMGMILGVLALILIFWE